MPVLRPRLAMIIAITSTITVVSILRITSVLVISAVDNYRRREGYGTPPRTLPWWNLYRDFNGHFHRDLHQNLFFYNLSLWRRSRPNSWRLKSLWLKGLCLRNNFIFPRNPVTALFYNGNPDFLFIIRKLDL